MTKMATMPIYGKNPSKSSSPEPADRFPRNRVCSIRDSCPSYRRTSIQHECPGPMPTSCSLSESCNIERVKFDVGQCLVGRENPLQLVKSRKRLF